MTDQPTTYSFETWLDGERVADHWQILIPRSGEFARPQKVRVTVQTMPVNARAKEIHDWWLSNGGRVGEMSKLTLADVTRIVEAFDL